MPGVRSSLKLIALLLLLLTVAGSSFSVPPGILWSEMYGGSNVDVANSIIQASDGGYAFTGYTRSYGSTDLKDLWLVKVDSSGVEEWTTVYGNEDDSEQGNRVIQCSDGGYAVAGYVKYPGAGDYDLLLVKIDPSGNVEWTSILGGAGDEEGFSVLETVGGFLVAGRSNSYGSNSTEFWIVTTDSLGNEISNYTYGGTYADGALSICPTSDGGYAMAGWTYSYGGTVHPNVLVIKIDSCFVEEWRSNFGGFYEDEGYDICQTVDGGYVITGYATASGSTEADVLLLKMDEDGDIVWSRIFGDWLPDYGFTVRALATGDFLIGASYYSTMQYYPFYWLIRTNSSGIMIWNTVYSFGMPSEPFSTELTSDGGYIMAGYIYPFSGNDYQALIIKTTSDLTLIEEHEAAPTAGMLTSSPSPFTSTTTLSYGLSRQGRVSLCIYDSSGRLVRTLVDGSQSAGAHSIAWNGRDDDGCELGNGIYFCRLAATDFSETVRVVILGR